MKSGLAVVCFCLLAIGFAGCETTDVTTSLPHSFSKEFGEVELAKMPPPPEGVYDDTDVDKRPLPIKYPPPQYPWDLRRRGVTGEAVVAVIVDEKGMPERIAVFRATDPEFAAAAATCLAKWTFSPAIRQGHPVRCRISVPIVFDLN